MLALLLAGLSKVRSASRQVESKNKLRQMGVAFQQIEIKPRQKNDDSIGGGSVFTDLLPYLELSDGSGNLLSSPDQFYLSSVDPSVLALQHNNGFPQPGQPSSAPHQSQKAKGTSSYCVNSIICNECRTVQDISDGSSNTILFSERYANCAANAVLWSLKSSICIDGHTNAIIPCANTDRRATFADKMYTDILPTRDGGGPLSIGTPRNSLFQVQPSVYNCDMNLVQSLTSDGLAVAMADGSVRVIRPSIDPSIYWSAVTPRGGEAVPLD